MKYAALLIFFLPILGMAQLSPLPPNKAHLSPLQTPRSSQQFHTPASRDAETLLFEDFESVSPPALPDNWDGGEPVEQQEDDNNGQGLGIFTDAWKTGDAYEANNGGYLPVPHISGNTFAYANDDGYPCNCDMEEVFLTLPPLDFSDKNHMMMTFDVYSQATFGGDNLSLEISIDDGQFITLFTAESSPEWQPVFVDLSLFDDEPNIALRFRWSDNGYWSSGAAVDNVHVAENVDYNVGILRAHTAEYTADWNDTLTISGEYSKIPLAQATPLVLGTTVKNKGALPIENVVLSVAIQSDGNQLASYNSEVVSILYPTEEEDLYVYTDFVPEELAEYTIDYELIAQSDEDPSDNLATRSFEVTSDVYALDDGEADSFRDNGGASFTIGNYFEVPNDGSLCYSIGVAIGANSVAGSEIHARIYNSDFIFETGAAPYTVTADDINLIGEENVVNIPFEAPYPLEGGKDYIAAIAYFGNPFWQFTVANSGSSQEQFSVFQNEFGDWFYVTTTPVVRMNLSPTVAVQETDIVEKPILAPNPVQSHYTLSWARASHGVLDIAIYDLAGRAVAQKTLNATAAESMVTPVNIDHLAPGVYHMALRQGQYFATTPLVKTR